MGRFFLAGLLVALLCLVSFLAASPSLHQWLHDDAGQASHQCAITLLQQQQVLPAAPASLILDAPVTLVFSAPLTTTADLPVSECRAFPSRAPPFFFVSQKG